MYSTTKPVTMRMTPSGVGSTARNQKRPQPDPIRRNQPADGVGAVVMARILRGSAGRPHGLNHQFRRVLVVAGLDSQIAAVVIVGDVGRCRAEEWPPVLFRLAD